MFLCFYGESHIIECVLVIISGGCVDISDAQSDDNVDAIMWAGYGGMYGGLAIADVILGTFA